MTLASAARAYSERLAWAVLPLRGKVPAIPKGRGYLDATTDPATISRWWRAYPDANVGVSCIGSNLVVLDVDPRHGGDRMLAELEARHGLLPPTVRQVTGSGGQHILFRPVGDSQPGALGKGIDVKWRGYIVTAPSVHPDTGRRYAWLPDLHPLKVRPAAMRHGSPSFFRLRPRLRRLSAKLARRSRKPSAGGLTLATAELPC